MFITRTNHRYVLIIAMTFVSPESFRLHCAVIRISDMQISLLVQVNTVRYEYHGRTDIYLSPPPRPPEFKSHIVPFHCIVMFFLFKEEMIVSLRNCV